MRRKRLLALGVVLALALIGAVVVAGTRSDAWRRWTAERALARAVADEDSDGVMRACDALDAIGGPEAFHAIVAQAAKSENGIYWQLVGGASGFQDRAALEELEAFVVDPGNGPIARDLVFALQNNPSPEARRALAHIVEKGSEDVKHMAKEILEKAR